jgi:hypothetical protein
MTRTKHFTRSLAQSTSLEESHKLIHYAGRKTKRDNIIVPIAAFYGVDVMQLYLVIYVCYCKKHEMQDLVRKMRGVFMKADSESKKVKLSP